MRVIVRKQPLPVRVRQQHMPTTDEIRRRAIELFIEAQRRITGETPTTPEDDELKEDGFWDQARNELMRGEENPALRRLREDIETLRGMDIPESQIKNMLEQIGIRMERVQRGVPKEQVAELNAQIERLEEEVKKLKAEIPAPPPPTPGRPRLSMEDVDRLYVTFENVISKGLRRGPVETERERFDLQLPSVVNLPFQEAEKTIRELAESIAAQKAPYRLPGISPFSGNATALFGFPFGMVRVKRVRVPPKIPAVCNEVETFVHLEGARSDALSRKTRNPNGRYGYAFDPDKHVWGSIECMSMPPIAELDNDQLVVLPTPERLEREEL